MKSLSNIKTFVRVAEVESFARASNILGLSTSAVSKAVARLEADLGVKLFHRTTRSVSLTPDGKQFYEGCQQLLLEFDALTAEVQGSRATPRGQLTISAPAAFGRLCLVPLLQSFMQSYPEITLNISIDDHAIDLAAQGIDIVIRTGQLADSANLIASRLVTYRLVVCASPHYLAEHGEPQHPEQLQRHSCLNFRNPDTGRFFPWVLEIDGAVESYTVSGPLVFDNADAVVRSSISSLGLSQMPSFLAKEAVSRGQLVEVLNSYQPPETPVWICYLDRNFVSPRIRAFVEFMKSEKSHLSTMCSLAERIAVS
ncbi:LysR family transcriptional regulator [Acaryochloris marina]|uniref:Transcriptional regulator, LysR family n=1 Tax=Acaryochloris marina (strain MBIC 11017) TaxID=329726 RepID=A8ZMF1_ACAM1|nr:LysR family transcriptional regulator [Acaryochloris marina]ABW32362.1 transcriptional regulator, LysR family [Acaryochloris marina MBIC11017]